MKERLLVLEDGSVYKGTAFGSDQYRVGELIFQTGMSGYQEIISDLSYYGQIVMMTYPAIGGCGINRDDFESMDPQIFGFVVKEFCEYPSNFRSNMTLNAFMEQKGIPGIADIDTRAITRKIRDHGTMKAIMAESDADVEALVQMLKTAKLPQDGVSKVSTQKPYPIPSRGFKVVMLDLGTKFGLIRELNKRGCDLVVMPYATTAEEILSLSCDGVVVSNGPGTPDQIPETVETLKKLIDHAAILGCGLGHQVVAQACGARIEKMRFGHHGNSTPIRSLAKNKVEFTAQNHTYAVNEESLKGTGLNVTHRALNDDTIEGLKHESKPILTVEFNPEAAPGADDTMYIFDEFMEMMKKGGNQNA